MISAIKNIKSTVPYITFRRYNKALRRLVKLPGGDVQDTGYKQTVGSGSLCHYRGRGLEGIATKNNERCGKLGIQPTAPLSINPQSPGEEAKNGPGI